jgi:hypothetical protein
VTIKNSYYNGIMSYKEQYTKEFLSLLTRYMNENSKLYKYLPKDILSDDELTEYLKDKENNLKRRNQFELLRNIYRELEQAYNKLIA